MSTNLIAIPEKRHYEPIPETPLTARNLNKFRLMEQLTHSAIALLVYIPPLLLLSSQKNKAMKLLCTPLPL